MEKYILKLFKEAIKIFENILDRKIHANLIEISNEEMKNISVDKNYFLFINQKEYKKEIFIQKEEFIKNAVNSKDKIEFIKQSFIHELTHLYEDDVIKIIPNEWDNILKICQDVNHKNIESELLAQYVANEYNNILKNKTLQNM